jgi:tryptophanyl-tRNA synthetase
MFKSNSNDEIRNSNQIRMFKCSNDETNAHCAFPFRHLNIGYSILIRHSNFEFRICALHSSIMNAKKRILTGDTPTGKLHLGHYVGSVENRLALQDEFDCYFIIANKHAFTTRADRAAEIRQSVIDIAMDYLAVGIDPNKSTIFIQSEVPAIDELTFFFAMLIPFNRLMRNPTLNAEIRDKGLGDQYSFGFPMYAVGQCADILAFRPDLVPVGEDQLPHLELTREVARRFDQLYCDVNPRQRRRFPRNPGQARPRAAACRHRSPRPGWQSSEDEQIPEQRHLSLG